jgi:hypothetical protein
MYKATPYLPDADNTYVDLVCNSYIIRFYPIVKPSVTGYINRFHRDDKYIVIIISRD